MWQKVACHVKLPGEHYNTSIVSGSPRSQQIKAVVFFFFVPGRSTLQMGTSWTTHSRLVWLP